MARVPRRTALRAKGGTRRPNPRTREVELVLLGGNELEFRISKAPRAPGQGGARRAEVRSADLYCCRPRCWSASQESVDAGLRVDGRAR